MQDGCTQVRPDIPGFQFGQKSATVKSSRLSSSRKVDCGAQNATFKYLLLYQMPIFDPASLWNPLLSYVVVDAYPPKFTSVHLFPFGEILRPNHFASSEIGGAYFVAQLDDLCIDHWLSVLVIVIPLICHRHHRRRLCKKNAWCIFLQI